MPVLPTIALDTNIWIYLTKEVFFELFVKLKQGKEDEEFTVLVNDVVIKEWQRNKAKTISSLADSIKIEYKAAKSLANHLSGEAKTKLLESLAEYKDEASRIRKATDRVNSVEEFMLSCKVFDTTEKQKLYVANLAIEKQPPFQNNKNNFNDALNYRSFCEFTEDSFPHQYDLIYVSNNPDDFIDKQTKEVHASITDGLSSMSIKNVTDLGEALQLAPELIDDFDDWIDAQLEDEAMYQLDIMRGK